MYAWISPRAGSPAPARLRPGENGDAPLPAVKIVDRYVTRHLLASYAMCVVSLLAFFIVVDLLSNLERVMSRGAFLNSLANYLSATVPIAYYQIAPGTFLMAAMFTLSGLSRNNELLALCAGGVSTYRVLAPIIAASLAAALAMAAVQELAIPAQADAIRRFQEDRPISNVVVSDTGGNVLRMAKYYPYTERMEDVVVTIFYPGGQKHWSVHARRACFAEDGWRLEDVRMYEHDEAGALQVALYTESGRRLPYVALTEQFFRTDIVPSDVESADRDVNYLTFAQLNSQYHRQKYLPHLRVKLHCRITFPLACFVLLLLGAPFALRVGRRAFVLNVAVCVALAGAFFVATFFFCDLGADGRLSPIAAAWLPIVAFAALGLALMETVHS